MAIIVIDEDSGTVYFATVLELTEGIAIAPSRYAGGGWSWRQPNAVMRTPPQAGLDWWNHIRAFPKDIPAPMQVLALCDIDTSNTWPQGIDQTSDHPGG